MIEEIINQPKSLDEWQATIHKWANATFQHDQYGIAKHTVREVVELASAVGVSEEDILANVKKALEDLRAKPTKRIGEESADVLILLLSLAGYEDFNLAHALLAKYRINLEREWGKRDKLGVSEHVPNPEEVTFDTDDDNELVKVYEYRCVQNGKTWLAFDSPTQLMGMIASDLEYTDIVEFDKGPLAEIKVAYTTRKEFEALPEYDGC